MSHIMGDEIDVFHTRKGLIYVNALRLDDPDALVSLLSRVPGANDPRVAAAHQLLRTLEPRDCPPLDHVWVAPLPSHLEGECLRGVITLNADGALYRHGDPVALAMLLHHEHFHATHPRAPELDALNASMRFAEKHGHAALVTTVRDRLAGEHARYIQPES